jgi:tight adherence protein B
VLIAVTSGLLLALAVWSVVPPAARLRLLAIHDREAIHGDALAGILARRRSRSRPRTEQLAAALRTLAAELRAGSTPSEALIRSTGSPPLWPSAITAARFGEPIDAGFKADADRDPELGHALLQLAACWHVGINRGSGLVVSLDRLVLSLRAQQEVRATVRNELAAPRATSRMLAFLPVVGVAMGYLLGADPISWFFGTSAGFAVLVIAIVLTVLGAIWTHRIVQQVECG